MRPVKPASRPTALPVVVEGAEDWVWVPDVGFPAEVGEPLGPVAVPEGVPLPEAPPVLVGAGGVEVRVTPTDAQRPWANCSAAWTSGPWQVEMMHCVAPVMKVWSWQRQERSL